MDLKTDLIGKAEAYCDEANISLARLATLVANDGKFFNRLRAGGGLTVKMYERFQAYFHDNPAARRAAVREPATPPGKAAA